MSNCESQRHCHKIQVLPRICQLPPNSRYVWQLSNWWDLHLIRPHAVGCHLPQIAETPVVKLAKSVLFVAKEQRTTSCVTPITLYDVDDGRKVTLD